VICDPLDVDLQVWLEHCAGGGLEFRLALASDIQAYLSKLEMAAKAMDAASFASNTQGKSAYTPEVLTLASASSSAAPAVRLVNSTLYDALKIGASDIHLESTAEGLALKFRIDGVLNPQAQVPGIELAEQVISRLKVLSELDIAERRIPQDGSFRVNVGQRDIDLRVSIMPSVHGEDAVIRILDKRTLIEQYGELSLKALGFEAQMMDQLRLLVEQPFGMLLVTGPTGSGKTTTLYAALSEINTGRDKIITIEDPVEYQLPGILQIPVNDKKGLSFARGLRSILRHDPDKIMVGEIRDRETAEIAVQSALTGHLVLSTVHANSVFDVFGRFTHMGLDPYAFASALNGVWAQRLIRINCPHCRQPYQPNAAELARSKLSLSEVKDFNFIRAQGCGDCHGTGYKGRRAIAEVLLLDDALRELIVEKRPIRQIKQFAFNAGTRTLSDAALRLVALGETTLEELRRVTLCA
jgi:general secretion pathway protein E